MPYSQFLSNLEKKNVSKVLISENQIEGELKTPMAGVPKHFISFRMQDQELTQKLIQSGVEFSAVSQGGWFATFVATLFPFLLLILFWRFIFGRMQNPSGEFFSIGKSKAKIYVEHDLKTRFTDVAGVDEAKAELKEVVDFLKDPQRFTRLGGRMPKGILLVGPPGTGKTLLARAIAGEAGVSFFSINGSEFVEMFVGLGAARVRDLFQQARLHTPCIIFIDELDALGKSRGLGALSGASNEEKEQTLNQLLAELDGFDPSPGVVLLAATNRPEVLDPALLRSGRFDRQIGVDKPDKNGRAEILAIHVRKIRASKLIDLEQLASITTGFSGADLENLVNEAALVATRRGASEVELQDFTAGVERIVGGLERRSRILTVAEKTRVAYHEMGHAAMSLALAGKDEIIHKVSIIPRGLSALGYTMRRATEDRMLMKQSELEIKMAVLLGGRASESVFLDEASTGAADDLDKVTEMARAMVMRYGMSSTLGLLTYDREMAPLLTPGGLMHSHDFSEETAKIIDQEISELVNRVYQVTMKKIRANRPFIENSVKLLLERETLDEVELKKLWETYGEHQVHSGIQIADQR